eukprot:scaffold12016_cov65-Attheya_sp.AAC.4
MATSVPPAAGLPAGVGDGGMPGLVALPPASYQSWFGNTQFDLLGGRQYLGLYTEQLVTPIGEAAQPPNLQTVQIY